LDIGLVINPINTAKIGMKIIISWFMTN